MKRIRLIEIGCASHSVLQLLRTVNIVFRVYDPAAFASVLLDSVFHRLRWHLVLLRNSFIAMHRITTITVATPDFEEALERATADH